MKAFVAHDKAFDWNEGTCKEVASMFAKASDVQVILTDSVAAFRITLEVPMTLFC